MLVIVVQIRLSSRFPPDYLSTVRRHRLASIKKERNKPWVWASPHISAFATIARSAKRCTLRARITTVVYELLEAFGHEIQSAYFVCKDRRQISVKKCLSLSPSLSTALSLTRWTNERRYGLSGLEPHHPVKYTVHGIMRGRHEIHVEATVMTKTLSN